MGVKDYITKKIQEALKTAAKDIPPAATWPRAHLRVHGKKEFLRRNSKKWESGRIDKREGTYTIHECVANLTRLFYEAGDKPIGADEYRCRHFEVKHAKLSKSWGHPYLSFKVELFWPERKAESLEEFKFFFDVEMKQV
ncbi:TPA: hypothetical protein HA265_04775 [Candidatus Woesearchaeota archaeon]|nr:hypothetical protein [Candidatus Woesearchaeota archaeon]